MNHSINQIGGQKKYNEGQTIIETVLFITFIAGVLLLFTNPEFNFIRKFNSQIEKLHTKRNEAISRIRKLEPTSNDYRGNSELSNRINTQFSD